MCIAELDTPAVVIDLDVMERNMRRLAAYCRQHNLKLRPHVKTHKIPELAQWQLRSGATGITVAKPGEAQVMVAAGIEDVLVAYPIASEAKALGLATLGEKARISVSLDSIEAASVLSHQAGTRGVRIGVLVEIDVGFRRCGLLDGQQAVSLARRIMELPGLEFQGLMFYPGHMLAPQTEQRRLLTEVNQRLNCVEEAFQRDGYPVRHISGGSTPTAYLSHQFHGVTEIRPGMYLFNDRNMLGAGVAALETCALCVLVTVVSTAVAGRAIVDGGSKTFSSDRFLAGDGQGFGLVREDPDAEFESMSEEHGHLNISRSSRPYQVGERLSVIPNHVCATINMHDEVYGVRGERVECTWRVAARGRVR